jgi:pimeloyl-ACP methyl ester carboxylesterase
MAFVGISLFLRRYIIRHVFTPKRKENKNYPNSTYENMEIELGSGTIRGWLIKSESSKGCFLLVHGWSSNKSAMLRYVDPLIISGYDVIIMDIVGHGQSDSLQKQVSIESFVQSITATIDYAEQRADINSHAIYVLGHSMGGTAASIVNATDRRIQALITDSMPTSLRHISQSMAGNITLPYRPFGWLLISWLLLRGGIFKKAKKEWRLEKIVKNQQSPALAIHGTEDTKVPISNVDVLLTHSNFKQVIKVETKGHHNCVKDNDFWDNIFRFITDNRQ